jgi:indolepyruvate ferredoxin oxidoreductase beta subunit
MKLDILIAGVGGQGTLLASKILGAYAAICGFDCKLSEVHGMAQRGGSVVTYVRYADKVYSPIIPDGEADILLAFEELEALRYSAHVKTGGTVILNTQKIMPLPVLTGQAKYPADIVKTLQADARIRLITADALEQAKGCGSAKAVNTVMLGILARTADLNYEKLQEALIKSVPAKFAEINSAALKRGYALV